MYMVGYKEIGTMHTHGTIQKQVRYILSVCDLLRALDSQIIDARGLLGSWDR